MSKRKWYEKKWQNKADLAVASIKEALEVVYNALNQGQQKQIIKDEKAKALFDLYGVEYNG